MIHIDEAEIAAQEGFRPNILHIRRDACRRHAGGACVINGFVIAGFAVLREQGNHAGGVQQVYGV